MQLEDKIKQQLEDRRIQPTASAWDRIETKLDTAQGKKKSKVVLWMGIAASFAAGVFLTALFFGGEGIEDGSNEVVSVPNNQEVVKDELKSPDNQSVNFEKQLVTTEQSDKEKQTETSLAEETTLSRKPALNSPRERTKTKSNLQLTPESSIVENTDQLPKNQSIKLPVDSNLVNGTEEGKATIDLDAVANAEVDALLMEAQREIASKEEFDSNTNRVDANALLLDAEYEVDPETFKDKIFKTLKINFDKAVEAVVSKDN